MASLRFGSVQDLYEAFPTAQDDVGLPPSNEQPLAFLQQLMSKELWSEAVSFCAYLLPRREAIWWGCESLRRIQRQFLPEELAALDLAETWVHEPEDPQRRQALAFGIHGNPALPATWLAMATGWSGGSIAPPEIGMVPAPPYQTARAIRTGLLMAMSVLPSDNTPRVMTACIESGIALAHGDEP
jgi:hypothetical protein